MRYSFFILILFTVSCSNQGGKEAYYCGAEEITNLQGEDYLLGSDGLTFGPAATRSKEKSHSGEYSLKLDETNEYGFTIELKDVIPEEKITISVWQSIEPGFQACLLVSDGLVDSFYTTGNNEIYRFQAWALIQANIQIPKDYTGNTLKIYVWNIEKRTTYVDDFEIRRIDNYLYHEKFELEKLSIHVQKSGMKHLAKKRAAAFKQGFLQRSDDDFVKTEVRYRDRKVKGQIRLKGNWGDHFRRDKWSFRLKLKDSLVDGMSVFSVQSPDTRGFLKEYIFHKLLEKEGIITPEYKFVQLYLNDVSYGIYALEEHLSFRMLQNQNRTNGVIMKFDDAPLWDELTKGDNANLIGLLSKADIKSYGDKQKTEGLDSGLLEAFAVMRKYQVQDSSVYTHFDLRKMAKFYALCDITRSYHALVWINIRFYYDYETKLMEPVGYDGYSNETLAEWANPYLGYQLNYNKYNELIGEGIVFDVFRHTNMAEQYFKYLDAFIDPVYIERFLEGLEEDLTFIESQIQVEFPKYTYDRNFIVNNARDIRVIRDSLLN